MEKSSGTVIDYLIGLPQSLLENLYQDPWTCQALFRSLPPLSKFYVLRMLFGDTAQSLQNWVKSGTDQQHKKAIERLLSLKICLVSSNSNMPVKINSIDVHNISIQLNPKFQQQLQNSLCQTGITSTLSEVAPVGKKTDINKLINFSQKCWGVILRYMIGKTSHVLSSNMADLLIKTNLMAVEDDDRLRITNKGFKYLLKDTYTQIWTLLLSYIENSESRNLDKKEVLSFLFQLSFLTFGKCYPIDGLSPTQKLILPDLREFGIIYQRRASSTEFYPTQLALTLSSGKVDFLANDKTTDKFVVIEPNYRLYAYTNDELQISIMSLFVKMKYHLPNMAMGVITRESIRAALMNGITAKEIVQYLHQHAHPEMAKNTPVLPETVQDQIRLWESERNRVSYERGVLYDGFPSSQYYQDLLKYATDIGVVIWSNTQRKIIMVTEEGHEELRKYLKTT